MDIRFNEEQRLLSDSIAKMLQVSYGFGARQEIVKSDTGWSPAVWEGFANLGLLSAPFGAEIGGFGGGPITVLIVMRALGRHLVVEPYFETVIVAGGLIEMLGSRSQKDRWLHQIMSGKAVVSPALFESSSRYMLNRVTARAGRNTQGYLLCGRKAAAMAAPWADMLVVSARTSGAPADSDGISLFVVNRHSPGVYLKEFKTIDGRRAAEIELDGVQVAADDRLGPEGCVLADLDLCRNRAIVALCAEATGAMEIVLNATVEYAKTRRQFGVALGSFQALQHRMADMFIAVEEATAITNAATWSLGADPGLASKLVAGAKVKVGEAGRFVGEQAVQIQGGMGMSDELNIGHYLKRLVTIERQYGDPAFHIGRFAQLGSSPPQSIDDVSNGRQQTQTAS